MGSLVAYRRTADDAGAMSDQALIAACATGDAAALAALFRRHNVALYRFLSRLSTVDAADLDDLVQATFVAVHRGAAGFRGGAAVKTWIFAIASNLAGKQVRGAVNRRSLRARVEEAPRSGPVGPDTLAAQRQMLDRLQAALAALPHDLRVVFVMCALEDVPGKDAARALGIREGTLWRRLHEARSLLRDAMEGT